MKSDGLICTDCQKKYSIEDGAKVGEKCRKEGCEGLVMVPFGVGRKNKESMS